MKISIVITEPTMLRNTAEAASVCATRYPVASKITIGIIGIAVVNTVSLTMGLRNLAAPFEAIHSSEV